MPTQRMCIEIVEALVRQTGDRCPLLRQCELFRQTCHVPNRIDLTEPPEVCVSPPPGPEGCKCKAHGKKPCTSNKSKPGSK